MRSTSDSATSTIFAISFATGPGITCWRLCWRSGQRSPIHNHALSTCGVRVLEGVATETVFEMMPCGLVKAVNSHDMLVSDVVVAQDAKIHQISNLQLPGHDLVTLHVYSPPLLRMDTYSLTEREVGEYRPMVLEQAGSGIWRDAARHRESRGLRTSESGRGADRESRE